LDGGCGGGPASGIVSRIKTAPTKASQPTPPSVDRQCPSPRFLGRKTGPIRFLDRRPPLPLGLGLFARVDFPRVWRGQGLLQSAEEGEELSTDWEKVAFVEGAGNSNSQKVYSFVDKNPVGGTKFAYRLKQIDIDGKFEYSDEIEVKVLPSKYELYQNYPNPFNPTTKIKFSLPENTKVKISVYDILGRELTTLLNKNIEAGYHSINFDAAQFTSGVYLYTIETSKFTKVKKMLLIK